MIPYSIQFKTCGKSVLFVHIFLLVSLWMYIPENMNAKSQISVKIMCPFPHHNTIKSQISKFMKMKNEFS